MRRALALALCFALAACGFRPMYGRSLGPALSSIYVEPIAEREGYELRNSLIDALQSDGDKAGMTVKTTLLPITLGGERLGVRLDPPRIGEHTRALLSSLGLAGDEIDRLYRQRAVA